MKTRWLPATAVLVAFLASACGAGQQASGDEIILDVYTSVAITLTAGAGTATFTALSLSTSTPRPTQTPEPTSTATSSSVTTLSSAYTSPSSCNSSVYLDDVTIEDGTELAPGETFTKTWEMSNTGSCSWSRNYKLVFVSGDGMEGDNTSIDQSVAGGETVDVSVDLTAPDDVGTYTGYWSLADASGAAFGQRVYVQIVVSDNAATSTPTATATATATTTAAPTATSTQTASTAIATATVTTTAVPPSPTTSPSAAFTATPTSTLMPDDTSTETPGG